MIFNWIYKKAYLRLLFKLSQLFLVINEVQIANNIKKDNEISNQISEKDFAQLDDEATIQGGKYRGIGVTIGLLGVLIIFCEVAPSGLNLGQDATLIFTYLKIAMMLWMAFLVWKTTKTNLRTKWIETRLNAEILRYRFLRNLIQDLKNDPLNQLTANNLFIELEKIFEQQIEYNRLKADQYNAIETFSDKLTWIGFSIAFIGACLPLFININWIIFPTTFVPALIAAIHGINGFLHLSDLSEDHMSMANRLENTRKGLVQHQTNPIKILELSEATYQILTNRDVQWVETAEKLGLKVG